MVLEFKSASHRKKKKVVVKSRSRGADDVEWESVEKNFIVESSKSSSQIFYARLKSVQCKHSGLYACYAEYYYSLKRLNSTSKRIEVIQRMRKPILRVEDQPCEESSTRCQNCASQGQHSRKSNETLTINCTMNVSLPVNSSHAFMWYYAVDGGELSEVKHGKSGAAISEVSQNFRYGSCTRVKQKTTTLQFITPQLGKVLRLQCMLLFKAQDTVEKFQDSIDICILDGQPNKDGDGKTTPQTGPRKEDKKTTLGKSKWILISVAAAVVIVCLAISMYYYNKYLDARDDSINKRKVAEIQKSSIRLKSEYKSFIYDGKLVIDLVPSNNALNKQEVPHDANEVPSAEDISMYDSECASVRSKK